MLGPVGASCIAVTSEPKVATSCLFTGSDCSRLLWIKKVSLFLCQSLSERNATGFSLTACANLRSQVSAHASCDQMEASRRPKAAAALLSLRLA